MNCGQVLILAIIFTLTVAKTKNKTNSDLKTSKVSHEILIEDISIFEKPFSTLTTLEFVYFKMNF